MNENVQKWIEYLRSGEFEQGTGYLNRSNEYCCLGVACEAYRRAGGDLRVSEHEAYGCVTYDGSSGTLPTVVKDWLGLTSEDGTHIDPDVDCAPDDDDYELYHRTLTDINDCGTPFNDIADLIERRPPGMFNKN